MTSEQSPLLASEQAGEADHNLIYLRFSPRRKHSIVALIAWAGFIPCASQSLFVQVCPRVADRPRWYDFFTRMTHSLRLRLVHPRYP